MDEGSWDPEKRAHPAWIIAAIIIAVALGGWLLTHYHPASAQDKAMLKAAQHLNLWLSRYYTDHTEFPSALEQAADYLPVNASWPVNPYNGKPIADCGSAQFDPATSVGMVHLEPVYQNETQTGWNLYVFGATGELDCLSSILVMDTN